MKRNQLFKIILTALLIALRVVFERFLSFNTFNQRYGFSFIALSVAAVLLGIPYTMAVAGIGDIVGTILFPQGAYFPGFTFTALLIGLSTAFFLHRNATPVRIVTCVLLNQIIGSVLLNSIWITMLYHVPYFASLPTRITQAAVMTVLQITVNLLLFSEKSYVRKRLVKATNQYLK
ncbi:MAG: folate family ECF transporter S component [Clostridia bacterium]|nr:folate family ECF transporter S component [Clostridia bacterium]